MGPLTSAILPSDTIMSAQLQADAAIEAARLQYAATLSAARIQGEYSLGGGVFVLLAAIIAFAASRRQMRMLENQDNYRKLAFSKRLQAEVMEVANHAKLLIEQVCVFSFDYKNNIQVDVAPIQYKLLEELLWELHASLGLEVIDTTTKLRSGIRGLNDAINEQKDSGAGIRSLSNLATAARFDKTVNNMVTEVGRKTVGEVLVQQAMSTLTSARDVSAQLKGKPIEIPEGRFLDDLMSRLDCRSANHLPKS